MSDPPATPEQHFAALVQALLDTPDVTYGADQRRSFGSSALKVKGSIFAMHAHERLVLKLPCQRVEALVAAGAGERYNPRGDGRQMKEWLTLDPASDIDWLSLAREALTFVASSR